MGTLSFITDHLVGSFRDKDLVWIFWRFFHIPWITIQLNQVVIAQRYIHMNKLKCLTGDVFFCQTYQRNKTFFVKKSISRSGNTYVLVGWTEDSETSAGIKQLLSEILKVLDIVSYCWLLFSLFFLVILMSRKLFAFS